MTQCTAKSKQSGQQCKRSAVPGRTVCHIHGGKSLAGPASPSLKTGRYSKYLPERLKDRYDQARADEELLFLREEIALLDSRLADLLQRVDTGESGALWANLTKVWADLQRAEEGSTEYLQAWIKVDELMKAGTTDYLAWQELQAVIEQRRKLVESERKRVVELQQVITAERAMVLLSVVVDVVRRHVTDRNALAAISADIGKLVAREPGRTVGSEGR